MQLTEIAAAERGAGPSEEPSRPARLSIGRKAGYASGQIVELVVGSMLNIFVLFYVTAVCGLSGVLAGVALGAGIVVDAIMDPMIGSLSDGWRSRFGRRVPFMVVSLIPIVLTFNLIFALPEGLDQTTLFLWLMLLSIALRISLSVFHLPYQALGAELTDDYQERSSLAAWRWGIGIIGTMAVIGLGYGVFLAGPEGLSNRQGYLPLTLSLSVLLLAGAAIAIWQGLSTRDLQRQAVTSTEAIHSRLFGEMREMFRNRTFRILFASSLLFNVEIGLNQAMTLHLLTFFWKLATEQIPVLGVAAISGLVLGAPLAGQLWRHLEKRTVLLIGMIGLVVCHSATVTIKLLGILPPDGHILTAFLAVWSILGSAMMALSIIAFISIIPDAADEHEHQFGTRREGMFFAGWAFASKAATGAGVLIAGVVLQLIDFPSNVAELGKAAAIPERTITLLAIASGPGAALLSVAGIAAAFFYRIDKKRHGQILADLAARKRGPQYSVNAE